MGNNDDDEKKQNIKKKKNLKQKLEKKQNILNPNTNNSINILNNQINNTSPRSTSNKNDKDKHTYRSSSRDELQIDYDREVEEFKKKIHDDSIHARMIKKIKPSFTQDWINDVLKIR